jgi:hypothetical protein
MHTHIYSWKLSPGFVLLAKVCPWLKARYLLDHKLKLGWLLLVWLLSHFARLSYSDPEAGLLNKGPWLALGFTKFTIIQGMILDPLHFATQVGLRCSAIAQKWICWTSKSDLSNTAKWDCTHSKAAAKHELLFQQTGLSLLNKSSSSATARSQRPVCWTKAPA